MSIKVAKLENLFWTNGSWERPNTIPDIETFHHFPDLLVDWNDNKTVGAILLTGDWNYAYCEGQWYFLKRLKVADREGAWYYGLAKDWWVNWMVNEVSIKGLCTKTSNKKLLLDNLDYVEPVIDNPCKLYRLNLTTDVSRHWWEDLDEIKKPNLTPEFFVKPTIDLEDWWKFLKQIEYAPVQDGIAVGLSDNREARYKKGVTLIAELKPRTIESHWKQKVAKKLEVFYNKNNLKDYVLTKVTQLGQSKVKNLYALTLNNKALGEFEETARVARLDFSGLMDIQWISAVQHDTAETKKEFEKLSIVKSQLDSKFNSSWTSNLIAESRQYKVLQRKVYLPYLRKNWATNNDYLYRTHLDETELSGSRAQNTSAVTEYTETDPLVPIYQGCFAQGIKCKENPHANYYLPYINQLDTALNYYISGTKTEQRQTNLNQKILWFNEENPPEFGFLIFGEKRERTDWTWWHYQAQQRFTIDVITGLKTGWDVPESSKYLREVDKWAGRVSKWWTNFELISSLYPYSWLYYFSALKDNRLKISYRDWTDWGGTTGFFGVPVAKEGEKDFSSLDIKSYLERDIDNNVLDLVNFDKRRNDFFNKKAIIESFRLPIELNKEDIFFSDLTAFWEEYDQAPNNYAYATELGWYLDVNKNHRNLKKKYKQQAETPKLVFYWNNNIKKYQLGIYYTYSIEHTLAKKNNDVIRVKFRETNSNTNKQLESAPDGITSKTILYHHIKPIRNEKTKKELQTGHTLKFQEFEDFAKTQTGEQLLKQIDSLLASCEEQRASWFYNSITEGWKRKYTLPTAQFRGSLPKIGNALDYETIFKMLEVDDWWNSSGYNYYEDWWDGEFQTYRGITSGGAIWAGWASIFGSDEAYDSRRIDLIKFGDGTFTLAYKKDGWVKTLKELLIQLKSATSDISHLKGETHVFRNTQDFFTRIDSQSLQQDIYTQLGLLGADNQIVQDDINIKDKLFELKGTDYLLWIDAEEEPHLVFSPQRAKTDILLEETKVFRLPNSETPVQDYIDAINQQTSLQVATASYPIQERLLFQQQGAPLVTLEHEDEEHQYTDNSFKVTIQRFSVEGKQNPNDYYIIEYQGARQLLDVKLGIPKRTVQQTRATDVVAMAQLAFEREKWREEFKNRNQLFHYQKQYQMQQFALQRERIESQSAQAGLTFSIGLISPVFGAAAGIVSHSLNEDIYAMQGLRADQLREAKLEQGDPVITSKWDQPILSRQALLRRFNLGRTLTSYAGNFVSGVANSAFQLRELSIQSRQLEAEITQALGMFAIEANQLQTEHTYNERQFALRLVNIGNVYEQGEVNDRDITDQYNKTRNLNDVHLIYRVPSRVQKEGLQRYYELYGTNCQIENVEFKFSEVLTEGDIWQFGFIEEINNLWAAEEKEALKSIFANGFKIISFRKRTITPSLPLPKSWQTKADEILHEADEHQKEILLNKLTTQLNQYEVINVLAQAIPDKNKLVDVITPYLDKTSLLAKLTESGDKEQVTAFVLKLLNKLDEDKVFDAILEHKDKEALVEKWIDGGSKMMRVLWDKYSDQTISKETYTTHIGQRDLQISAQEEQLVEGQKQIIGLQKRISTINQQLDKQASALRVTTLSYQHEQEKTRDLTREVATEKKAKEDAEAQVTQLGKELLKEKSSVGEITKAKSKLEQNLKTKTEENKQLTLQYDQQLQKLEDYKQENIQLHKEILRLEQEEKPVGSNLIDLHKNVDYLITKDTEDKLVITAWNKEKGIWQEETDLIVKKNSNDYLLRILKTDEQFETSQYILWSYYSSQKKLNFDSQVKKYSELSNNLDGKIGSSTEPRNAYAWVGRVSIELDHNIPYLKSDGSWPKSYWYHLTKGWFDYDIGDGAIKVESYEKYQEVSKNIVTDLQKELKETKDSLEAVREIEKNKQSTHANKFASSALLSVFHKLHFSARDIFLIVSAGDFNFSSVSAYYFNIDKKIWCLFKVCQYEYKKLWTYRSKTPWAWRFTDESFVSDIIRDEWLNGYSTEWGNTNLSSKCTRNSSECGVRYALHVGARNVMVLYENLYYSIPKTIELATNTNYKNLKLNNPIWIDDNGHFTQNDLDSTGNKKLTTYLEYLDFLGFKWSEKKEGPVLKDEED